MDAVAPDGPECARKGLRSPADMQSLFRAATEADTGATRPLPASLAVAQRGEKGGQHWAAWRKCGGDRAALVRSCLAAWPGLRFNHHQPLKTRTQPERARSMLAHDARGRLLDAGGLSTTRWGRGTSRPWFDPRGSSGRIVPFLGRPTPPPAPDVLFGVFSVKFNVWTKGIMVLMAI